MRKKLVIIGTGGSGLAAAIAAKNAGVDVTVISKTSGGLASCTAYSAGIFTLACGGVTREEHFKKTMQTGMNLNNAELVTTLANEAEKSLLALAELGVTLKFGKGSVSARKSATNELMGGGGFQRELLAAAVKAGAEFVEWTLATSLSISGGRVTGVRIQNWRTGKCDFIPADAVVIASGGGGQIYGNTDNPSRITGDGYALALKAGLKLRDMEFVQFYPMGWNEPGLPKWMADVALVDYIRITDSAGCEFLKDAIAGWGYKNGREANLYARDRCSILMAEKDRAGGVYAHIEDADENMWNDEYFKYCLTLNPKFFDGKSRPLRFAPLEHYFCGGIEIDSFGRTEINGLYACGEVTGGVDGANRVGGNALSNIVTFGLRAGETAAQECAPTGSFSVEKPTDCGIFKISAEGEAPAVLRKELQTKAWEAIGPIRREKEMLDFLDYLEAFKKRGIKVQTPYQRLLALEMDGLYYTARAVAEAAVKRKESVGTHYRV